MKKLILFAFVLLSFNANAADEKYMKLDETVGGGYFTIIADAPCEIEIFLNDYPLKGVIDDGHGGTRRACWKRVENHWNDRFESMVIAKEEIVFEDGSVFYPTHSFAQYYFRPEKQ
jgi:hypothetical protein